MHNAHIVQGMQSDQIDHIWKSRLHGDQTLVEESMPVHMPPNLYWWFGLIYFMHITSQHYSHIHLMALKSQFTLLLSPL